MNLRKLVMVLTVFFITGFTLRQESNIEFVCMRKHSASNTCHYNFTVDGGNFRYVDIGCKQKKKEEVIEKVKKGDLALAKEWKLPCLEKAK
jgi:hypothetical protein